MSNLSETAQQVQEETARSECLFTLQEIEDSLDRMALAINSRYHGQEAVLLCVMNGGLTTAGHLLPRLKFPLQVGYVHLSRYRDSTAGQDLEWLVKPSLDLQGKQVLLVDDIYDEGVTLMELIQHCEDAGAASVEAAVLLNKPGKTKAPGSRADYCALEVSDRYVFGFGLDYRGYLRNAPGIFALTEATG